MAVAWARASSVTALAAAGTSGKIAQSCHWGAAISRGWHGRVYVRRAALCRCAASLARGTGCAGGPTRASNCTGTCTVGIRATTHRHPCATPAMSVCLRAIRRRPLARGCQAGAELILRASHVSVTRAKNEAIYAAGHVAQNAAKLRLVSRVRHAAIQVPSFPWLRDSLLPCPQRLPACLPARWRC